MLRLSAIAAAAALTLTAFASAQNSTTAAGNATQAYVYGYGPVNAKRNRDSLYCRSNGTSARLIRGRYLSNYNITNTSLVAITPNIDTLYAQAFLDLRQGPVYVSYASQPAYSRFLTFQVIDAYTNTLKNFDTVTYGYNGASFLILPPAFNLTNATGLPPVTATVTSTTWDALLFGRTEANDTAADVDVAYAYSLQYNVTHVPGFVSTTAPPALPAPNCSALGSITGFAKDPIAFWNDVGAITLSSPPPSTAANVASVSNIQALGLGRQNATYASLTSAQQQALQLGVTQGQIIVDDATVTQQTRVSWIASRNAGNYSDNYLARAGYVTNLQLANVPNVTLYLTYSQRNSTNPPLIGSTPLTLTFTNATLPPVATGGFWSVASYDNSTLFYYVNSQDRYGVTSHSPKTVVRPDGSIVGYFSNTPPPASLNGTVNWVPTPPGAFFILLRLYGATDVNYVPPPFLPAS